MKVAAIDIGTNSIRLLKAQIINRKLISGDKSLSMTRIGEGVNETGQLSEAAMDRSVKALADFESEARAWGAEAIFALATSAVRDAANSAVFLKRVREACGLEIEVITGDVEARLGFMGVLAGAPDVTGNVLVIDVGGGSTELIVGNRDGIRFAKSVNVGAVRMTGKHVRSNPISDSEFKIMHSDIDEILSEAIGPLRDHDIDAVVGIGGTATTLGAMKLSMETYDRDRIQNSVVTLEETAGMVAQLKTLTVEERKHIKGLQPKRADIILAGAMVIEAVMTALDLSEMRISDYDNLEGCLIDKHGL